METIVIIGAGASGLACMNELVKTNKYKIIVLEQSKKAARKILASGNGRCNVSNLNMDIKYYNHQLLLYTRHFVAAVVAAAVPTGFEPHHFAMLKKL